MQAEFHIKGLTLAAMDSQSGYLILNYLPNPTELSRILRKPMLNGVDKTGFNIGFSVSKYIE